MSFPSASIRTKDWGSEILTDAALEGQFDILHQYMNDMLNSSSGHGHSGGGQDGPKIDLTVAVSDILPVANGGTGVATLAALGNLFYPIGSLYCNFSDSTNPGTLLGFGTWVAVGGTFLVGVDGSTEFLSIGQTGGEKTHTLTIGEMPNHNHTGWYNHNSGSGSESADGGSNCNIQNGDTTFTGGGAAHNTLPPYIAIYMWKRTV